MYQPADRRLNRLRAPKYPPVSPDQYLMHENAPTKPSMPGVENFSFLGPVGVMLSSCTIWRERTGHWTRMRRSLARFSKSDASCRTLWLAGCITNTSGFRFSARTGITQCLFASMVLNEPRRSESVRALSKGGRLLPPLLARLIPFWLRAACRVRRGTLAPARSVRRWDCIRS